MKEKVFNKLVRDKIPEKIKENGEYLITRTLTDKEFDICLNEKLKEELNEVLNSKTKKELEEELADLLEVIIAKAKFNDISYEKLEQTRIAKRNLRGGFDNKVFLVKTSSKEFTNS